MKENDLKYCVESIIRERVRGMEEEAGVKSGKLMINSSEVNSVYREVLFLTLVSLGQDNIDLTAFDR